MAKKIKIIKIIKEKSKDLTQKLIGFWKALKPRFTRRNIIIALVVLLLILFWRLFLVKKNVWTVQTYNSQKGEIVETISSSGSIKADKIVNLAFQTPGQIAWISINEGDQVYRGQAISGLDTVIANSQYEIALNNLRSAQATVDRVHDQVKDHSGDETFAIKETRTLAEVANDNAYEAVKIGKKQLDNSLLIAPFSGIAALKYDNFIVGANVLGATPMVTIVNPDSFFFDAEVNEVDVVKIKEVQKVNVTLDAYSTTVFTGTVKNIGLLNVTTSTGGNAYKVKIELLKKEGITVRLGMKGDAEFVLETVKDVLLVPSGAIVEGGNNINYVWVIGDDNKAHKVEIKTGASSIDMTQINSGIKEGEKIISVPPLGMKEGDKVIISQQ